MLLQIHLHTNNKSIRYGVQGTNITIMVRGATYSLTTPKRKGAYSRRRKNVTREGLRWITGFVLARDLFFRIMTIKISPSFSNE